jgi:hypothetical protein
MSIARLPEAVPKMLFAVAVSAKIRHLRENPLQYQFVDADRGS